MENKIEQVNIVVIADTHGNTKYIDKIAPIIEENDMLVFLGDGIRDISPFMLNKKLEIHFVEGNCDFTYYNIKEKVIEILGHKILITHGDRFSVKQNLEKLYNHAKSLGVEMVLYGHTHISSVEKVGEITFVNPGSLSFFTTKKSFAYVSITKKSVIAVINDKI